MPIIQQESITQQPVVQIPMTQEEEIVPEPIIQPERITARYDEMNVEVPIPMTQEMNVEVPIPMTQEMNVEVPIPMTQEEKKKKRNQIEYDERIQKPQEEA